MMPLLRNLVSVAVLASTSVLLIADSACDHAAYDVTFDVSNNSCGPSGTLRVMSARDACGLEVEGAQAVGLPKFGDPVQGVDDPMEGGWTLSDPNRTWFRTEDGGTVPADAGETTIIEVTRRCETKRVGDTVLLTCTDGPPGSSSLELGRCEATLTPS